MNESRSEKNFDIAKELEKEQKDINRKKIIKIVLWITIPLILFVTISYILLRFIGNMGLVVREYAIYSDTLPKDFDGFKIVQFSDLHYNDNVSMNTVKKLVKQINKTNPDIVIFTGDLIDKDYVIQDSTLEELMSEFNSINAKIGKYAIRGEEDFQNFNKVFDNSNFKILENTVEKIYLNSSSIDLLTVDETYSKDNIKGYNEEVYTITLIHKPDLTTRILSDFNTKLILAGHSHNGQVVLPLIGGVMRKEGAKKYSSSHHKINNTDLYISGGIGNSGLNWRLLNHPSINFYRLRTSK